MKRVVCYAHFDGKGQVRPFVLHALQMIRPWCADLVFVSNSPLTDQALLASSATHVIVNNNTGYDFYMWKLGLESVDLSLYDEVILMNSSVFGPLFAMEPVFSAMAAVACDFWGITECFQMQPHIQSYFLVFRKAMVRSEAFRLFWNSILPYTNKLQVIQSYEVGLTQWFVESGFRAGVYCCFEQIGLLCRNAGKRLRKKDNTSVKFALELLQAGSPFFKRDAVRNRKVDLERAFRHLDTIGYARHLVEDEFFETPKPCCPLCGSSGKVAAKGVQDYRNLHEAERYDYLRCQAFGCGVIWRIPLTATSSVTVATLPLQLPEAAEKYLQASDELPLLMRGLSPGTVFVVGADAGQLEGLKSAGWHIAGCLPEKALQNSLNPALDLLEGTVDACDCILIAQGFGQIHEPDSFLRACYQLLKPGGRLVLVTPNSAALLCKIFKGYWYGFNSPRNRIIHSRASLRSQITAVGFKIAKSTTTARQSGRYAWFSFEAVLNKWISVSAKQSGLGLRLLSVLVKWLICMVNTITRDCGDECVVVSKKED